MLEYYAYEWARKLVLNDSTLAMIKGELKRVGASDDQLAAFEAEFRRRWATEAKSDPELPAADAAAPSEPESAEPGSAA